MSGNRKTSGSSRLAIPPDLNGLSWKQWLSLMPLSIVAHIVLALFFANVIASDPPHGDWPHSTQHYKYLLIIDQKPQIVPDRPHTTITETYYYYSNAVTVTDDGTFTLGPGETIIERRITPGNLKIIKSPIGRSTQKIVALPETTQAAKLILNPTKNWRQLSLNPLSKELSSPTHP